MEFKCLKKQCGFDYPSKPALQDGEQHTAREYTWDQFSFEGNVDAHEYLEFKHSPNHPALIEYLQHYLFMLLELSIEHAPKKDARCSIELNIELVIDNIVYRSTELAPLCEAIIEKLPTADGFVIDLASNCILLEYCLEKPQHILGAGMLHALEQYKSQLDFEYKLSTFYYNDIEIEHEKIYNGERIDVFSNCTDEIVDRTFDEKWYNWEFNLLVNFDFEKHHDVLLQLQDIVRTSIPQDQLEYCENEWKQGCCEMLCSGIQWRCSSLREIQDFLDKINSVILPIKDEIDPCCQGEWLIQKQFAFAICQWTDEGFKLEGHQY